MMHDPMNNDMGGRHPHDGRFMAHYDDTPERMPREGLRHGREAFETMPRHCGEPGDSFHAMPRGHGRPGMPGGHGFGPGGYGPGGMPPRRPDPRFLKRRIDDSDLMDLIDMAGRMAQRRPQGGPARSQSLILSILAGRDVLSQRELQQMMGIQPGSLSELLSKLEGKGYLVREKAEDRRGNLLRITEEGRKAIPTADDLPGNDPFAALTDEQQDQLAALLRTLLDSWVDAMETVDPRPLPHRDRPVEL